MTVDVSHYIDLFKALLTPTIAIIAAYIAYQQYRLARQKQDIEVYDRRLYIYTSTIELLRSIEHSFDLNTEDYHRWELLLFEAELLFDDAVVSHLQHINTCVSKIVAINFCIENGETYDELEDKTYDQLHTEALCIATGLVGRTKQIFKPYFNLIRSRHKIKRRDNYREILEENMQDNEPSKSTPRKDIVDDDVPF